MRDSPREALLPRFSLERRITVLVLLATVVVLGAVATVAIPIELIPQGYTQPFLRVWVPWRQAPTQEVLDKITLPLEEELATVRGLDRLNSFSRTGFAHVFMSFKLGTDMDVAYREVRDRVERTRTQLPDDVEQVFIGKHDDAAMPVAMVGLAVDPTAADLYSLIQNEIILPLSRIDGVASVEANGLVEKEVLIELDRERVTAAGLNIYQLTQDLARDNFSLASGHVRAGDKKLLLRSVARHRDIEAVKNLPVSPSLRLKDVAAVLYEAPERNFRVRVNSRPAYALMVLKEAEANTLEVTREVKRRVDELAHNPRLQTMQIGLIMDQGEIILDSLFTLLDSGQVGGLFAVLVLFFFLRRLRMSLIIALAIPLSMVIALVVMYFAGETLNILSLLGLMISVGLLVDNSVVVAENIHRLHNSDLGARGRREVCIRGAGEIALAITTATLTTIVVFLPVALVEGQGQFYLLRLALPISVSLVASLLVALIFIPLSVYLTLPRRGTEAPSTPTRPRRTFAALRERARGLMTRAYELTFGALNRLYASLLRYFLHRRLDLVLLLVGLFAVTVWGAQERLEIVPMQEDEQSFFEIDVEMPRSNIMEETEDYFRRAEAVVEKLKDELGLDFYIVVHSRNWGEIQGALKAERDQELTPRQIVDRILEDLPQQPGVKFYTGRESEVDNEEQQARQVYTLYGDEPETLQEVAQELEVLFTGVEGVLGVKRATERPPKELALTLDRKLAQRQGVNPRVVAGVVSYALRGQPLSRMYVDGRDIPVRVRFQEEDRETLAELGNFTVPSATGEALALTSLVKAEELPTAAQISRRNKRTARRMTLELEEGREQQARDGLAALIRQIDLPEGVTFGEAQGGQGVPEEAQNLIFAAYLSVVFVYLLMGFLFESFLLPMAILVTIPLAGLGVAWSHLLAGRSVDFLGLVGVVLLTGVVVNNGIVLLDYVNRLRRQGRTRDEALILAAEGRFRPILMTALTTICGMIPLTLQSGNRFGLSYTSFGLALIGGMVTASLFTLLAVPVFYTLFEDARERLLGALMRPAQPAGEP